MRNTSRRSELRWGTCCDLGLQISACYKIDKEPPIADESDRLNVAPNANVSIERVPGAFEIPVVVRELARQEKADAVIACGVILKGKTDHARNLSRSVTDALQRIAIDHGVPVINAVLSFDNETQARERCFENKINRGTEVARAAVKIADVMSKLRWK